mgnify:CR=1 FL=1
MAQSIRGWRPWHIVARDVCDWCCCGINVGVGVGLAAGTEANQQPSVTAGRLT